MNAFLPTLILVSIFVATPVASTLLFTRSTLNYRYEILFEEDREISRRVVDIVSNQEIQNAEWISEETVLEEKYEDAENLQVLRYDLNGNLLSQRYFKKDGANLGELKLSEAEVRALEEYDVEDEELPVLPIQWDQIIFADRNFARDQITRWSETRDYRIKTEYTSEGLIFRRQAWNKHTGQKIKDEPRLYLQTIAKDIVQNHRGFLEIHYNALGEIVAIRSWDRITGRVVEPPKSVPFTFRLEQDHIPMNYEQHKSFQKDFFERLPVAVKKNIVPGQTMFPKLYDDWRLWKGVGSRLYFGTTLKGQINSAGRLRKVRPDAFSLGIASKPGKYPLQLEWDNLKYRTFMSGDVTVKNTRFPLGANVDAHFDHFRLMTSRSVFSRSDGELVMRGGLLLHHNRMAWRDGSRRVSWDEWTAQPGIGYDLKWFVSSRTTLITDATAGGFGVGGTQSISAMGGVELRQRLPFRGPYGIEEIEAGLGHRLHDYRVKADTDTLREVRLDHDFSGSYLHLNVRF